MASIQDLKDVLDNLLATTAMQAGRLLAIDKDILDLKEALRGGMGGTQGDRQSSPFNRGYDILSMLGKSIGAAMGSPTPFGGVGNLISGAGSIAGQLPGGQGLGAILNFTGELGKGVDVVMSFTRTILDANLRLGHFSGAMALVEARQEMADILYQIKLGGDTAESAAKLSQAFNKMREELTPAVTWWSNFKNKMATEFLHGIRLLRSDIFDATGGRLGGPHLEPGEVHREDKKAAEYLDRVGLDRWIDKYSKDWATLHGRPRHMVNK